MATVSQAIFGTFIFPWALLGIGGCGDLSYNPYLFANTESAVIQCIIQGKFLVKIEDSTELDRVKTYINCKNNNNNPNKDIWIGLHYDTDDNFVWVMDQSEVVYFDWAPFEPNATSERTYASLSVADNLRYRMTSESEQLAFVCEGTGANPASSDCPATTTSTTPTTTTSTTTSTTLSTDTSLPTMKTTTTETTPTAATIVTLTKTQTATESTASAIMQMTTLTAIRPMTQSTKTQTPISTTASTFGTAPHSSKPSPTTTSMASDTAMTNISTPTATTTSPRSSASFGTTDFSVETIKPTTITNATNATFTGNVTSTTTSTVPITESSGENVEPTMVVIGSILGTAYVGIMKLFIA